ncbi:MAG: hypothetical protein DLM66_00145 [Candidatus Dormiibacter spiritus]|nr:MAG: hypothetical protein DLM66_00145 [Candidatus Dormibacteraeota bacterium]
MAFSFVQGFGGSAVLFTGDNTTTSSAMAFASNNSAHNMLVMAIGCWASPPPGTPATSISDTAGNTWSTANRLAVLSNYDSQSRVELWWVPDCLAGANTVTVTFPLASAYKVCYAAEYAGGGGVLLDAWVSGYDSAAATSHSSGKTPATMAGDLVLGLYSDASTSSTIAATDGKTARANQSLSVGLGCILTDSLSSTAAEQSAAWSSSISYAGVSLCAAFKSVARPAPAVTMAAAG